MHEVFAAVRLWQLMFRQELPDHADVNGERIFGKRRWQSLLNSCKRGDERDRLMDMGFATLHTGGWIDDPKDSVRTLSNMEMATIRYVDHQLAFMDNWPIYVSDEKNPNGIVGVEQVFDVVLLYEDGKQIRFIGTLDGLVRRAEKGLKAPRLNELCLDENKTAARLDDAWRASFELSYQVTGYCKICEVVFGFPVYASRVIGLRIEASKGESVLPIQPLRRNEEHFGVWARWVRRTVDVFERHEDDYEGADRFTHSCNRYYRPCALIPFCGDSVSGRREAWDQMVPADLSPSEMAASDR